MLVPFMPPPPLRTQMPKSACMKGMHLMLAPPLSDGRSFHKVRIQRPVKDAFEVYYIELKVRAGHVPHHRHSTPMFLVGCF